MFAHYSVGDWAAAALSTLFTVGSVVCDAGQAQKARPEETIDALNGVFGVHPGSRPVHAKGVVLNGEFRPAVSAATVSTAPHLQKTATAVTIRFSDFAGIPDIPDTEGLARPHGLALQFHLPDGCDTDIVAHSFNGFPAATTSEFRDLLIALAKSGASAPKPTPLDIFLQNHPAAKAFLSAPKPAPESFATLPYYGVNSFKFTNAVGVAVYGRYQILPAAGTIYLPPGQTEKMGPDHLRDEIRPRVAKGPVVFRLVVQIAKPGDRVDDPSVAWPDDRPTVELGTLAITSVATDSEARERSLLFLPGRLTQGIEPADPMIQERTAAYHVSFRRRNQ
jgi:catalase